MDIEPIIEKMRAMLPELEQQMADPELFADRERSVAVSREHQRLTNLLERYDWRSRQQEELANNLELLETEDDPEFREMVEADITQLRESLEKLDVEVKSLLLPPRENDSRNSIIEIRPAAGGDEAALFAGALYRMLCRFADERGWRNELLSLTETDLGGIREVSFCLTGEEVFRYMRYESGVHRVQRVPTTETSGRIHTSTVTVAVLPEAQEVDIEIRSEDLKMDVFRSSGPGGQSVNTTDSAVRLTHIPTGVSVASQQEKSQHRNREIAMRILRARLLEREQQEEQAKQAAERKSQVGTGDRSERIRTYNFPQNRVTDHRYGITMHNLPAVMEGELKPLVDEIIAIDNARRLEEEASADSSAE